MADIKSELVSNYEATPRLHTAAHLSGARLRRIVATVEKTSDDGNGSKVFLCPVWSGWSIQSVRLLNDALTGATAVDLGLYRTDGATAVDAAVYASAINLTSASVVGVEQAFEARDIDQVGSRIWQDLGLSADPNSWYYLALTGTTFGTAAGTISAIVEYVDGS
tara:strand:+ start:321 stop:812 length:492 start_codon:yes stop_codon:yes gene_type:complete